MWIKRLQIENFRGFKRAHIDFGQRQTLLVGPNGAGKSTVLESLALLLGRDKLVRALTEHDFYESDPCATDRIRLIVTLTGFETNVAGDHAQWFSERRGVPKWLGKNGALLPEPKSADDALSVQIGFCARFDRAELTVETVRYFHDDDSVIDPFDEDIVQTVPGRLLTEIGFLLVPAHRTWDRLVSFNSELFRKILDSSGSLEATEVLSERDRLRRDEHRVDLNGALNDLRKGINADLKRLMPGEAALELRLTGTDADSLLHALVPHYRYAGSVSLPAGRHGSGLLSVQTSLLVLQVAERRRKAKQNVIIVVEEPELHMPPGIQVQILHELRNGSNQLVATTHSPRVAAVCSALDVRVVNIANTAGNPIVPLLRESLPTATKNGVRKLFHESRQDFIEAIMHRFVIVPEGRTDTEWLRAFAVCAAADLELGTHSDQLPFGTCFGIAPTHDACIAETIGYIRDLRGGVIALVDGDPAGDGYVTTLSGGSTPPMHVVQWPLGWVMEDVVGWILSADATLVAVIRGDCPTAPRSVPEVVTWLKTNTSEGGAKTDFLVHEAIGRAILTSESAKGRVRSVLDAFTRMAYGASASNLHPDLTRSAGAMSVWRFALES